MSGSQRGKRIIFACTFLAWCAWCQLTSHFSPPPSPLRAPLLAYAWAYAAIVIPLYRLILSRVRARLACQNDISHTQPARLCLRLPLSLSRSLSLSLRVCVQTTSFSIPYFRMCGLVLPQPLYIHRIALFARLPATLATWKLPLPLPPLLPTILSAHFWSAIWIFGFAWLACDLRPCGSVACRASHFKVPSTGRTINLIEGDALLLQICTGYR